MSSSVLSLCGSGACFRSTGARCHTGSPRRSPATSRFQRGSSRVPPCEDRRVGATPPRGFRFSPDETTPSGARKMHRSQPLLGLSYSSQGFLATGKTGFDLSPVPPLRYQNAMRSTYPLLPRPPQTERLTSNGSIESDAAVKSRVFLRLSAPRHFRENANVWRSRETGFCRKSTTTIHFGVHFGGSKVDELVID